MDREEVLAEAPDELRVGTGALSSRYELARDVVAIHQEDSIRQASVSLRPMETTAEADEPGSTPERGVVGPVYRLVPGGGVAVPTGRALVRFAEGELADRYRDRLAEAGYELEEVLSYAPQAAWVRAKSGSITDTLKQLERLSSLPGVENVEPQMLSERGRRS